jgi:hypothetical protein
MRKILYSCIVFGLLLISSTISAELIGKKIDDAIIQLEDPISSEFIPTFASVELFIREPFGKYEIRLKGNPIEINNWSGTEHMVKFEWFVDNSYSNFSFRSYMTVHTRIREWLINTRIPHFLFMFTNSGNVNTPEYDNWFADIQIPIKFGKYKGEKLIRLTTADTDSGYMQIRSFTWYIEPRAPFPGLDSAWNILDVNL